MTTALEVITDAGVACGGIDPTESLDATLAQRILRRFNDLVASWSNERLFIYSIYLNTLPLTAGQASYSTSLLADGRPIAVDNAFVRMSNVDYWLDVIGQQQYNAIGYKISAGIPYAVYLDAGWPDSTLYFFDVAYGGMTAHLYLRRLLQDDCDLTTDISLPPGYKKALIDGLAVDIASAIFGMEPSPSLQLSASRAMMRIKVSNSPKLVMDSGVPGRVQFNIFSGNNERV